VKEYDAAGTLAVPLRNENGDETGVPKREEVKE